MFFVADGANQDILHKPTFAKEYNEFWKDQSKVSLHWIAQLFMVMALGVFFSSFAAPHELQSDSPAPAMDTFKRYRGAAGWALIWSVLVEIMSLGDSDGSIPVGLARVDG